MQDPDDVVSFARAREPYLKTLRAGTVGARRLAFVRTPVWTDGDAEMRKAIEGYAGSLGTVCVPVELSDAFDRAKEWHGIIMGAESAHYYGPLMDAHPSKMSAALQERLVAGRKMAAPDYILALEMRERL